VEVNVNVWTSCYVVCRPVNGNWFTAHCYCIHICIVAILSGRNRSCIRHSFLVRRCLTCVRIESRSECGQQGGFDTHSAQLDMVACLHQGDIILLRMLFRYIFNINFFFIFFFLHFFFFFFLPRHRRGTFESLRDTLWRSGPPIHAALLRYKTTPRTQRKRLC